MQRRAGDRPLIPLVKRHKIATEDPVGARNLSNALTNHVVPKTRSSYTSAFKKYTSYCDTRDLPYFPADPIVMSAYFIHISTSVQVASIGHYAAAIQYFQGLESDMPWVCKGDDKIRRTMRYLKRTYPRVGKALKLAISCATVAQMVVHIAGYPDWLSMAHNDRVFVAASMLGVCGFLRGGEFLAYPGSGRPLLRQCDVRVDVAEGSVKVRVVQPKNMWWIESADVLCFNPPAGVLKYDLVTAILLYRLMAAGQGSPVLTDDGPAFVMANGKALSREFMISRTSQLLLAAKIQVLNQEGVAAPVKAASWRAGGVRSALDARVPVPIIMALGRWRSIAWESYLMQTTADLKGAQLAMWSPLQTVATTLRVGDLVPNDVFADADVDAVSGPNAL